MPMQSGSDRVLKRMIRRYSIEEYVERLGMLREAAPGLTLSTDVIVGFPGETREDFDATLGLVERIGFVNVFAFKYSERPATPATRLGDDIPEEEKTARLAALLALTDEHRQLHLESLVGTRASVLVEGPSKGQKFSGRTERSEIVHLEASGDPTGEILDVTITRAYRNSLEGEAVDAVRRATPALRPHPSPPTRERRALPVL
jgi:tRNA-2-methylthio-N6-dimethylallyladenosine synthase